MFQLWFILLYRISSFCVEGTSYPVLKQEYIGVIKSDEILKWPSQKAYVRMVSHKRRAQKDYNPIPQYFISSEKNPQLIAEAIDNRWRIENGCISSRIWSWVRICASSWTEMPSRSWRR